MGIELATQRIAWTELPTMPGEVKEALPDSVRLWPRPDAGPKALFSPVPCSPDQELAAL